MDVSGARTCTNTKRVNVAENKYIIKYNRDAINASNWNTVGQYKSLVYINDKLVCVAPPKSAPFSSVTEQLAAKWENPTENHIWVEEMIDGTMVNLFWDPSESNGSGDWNITTRSVLSGRGTFFRSGGGSSHTKTFRDMFLECMTANDIEFSQFDPAIVYSFVMQHPDGRVVSPVEIPTLYLVDMFKIHSEDHIENLTHLVLRPQQLKEVSPLTMKLLHPLSDDSVIVTRPSTDQLRFPMGFRGGKFSKDAAMGDMYPTMESVVTRATQMHWSYPGLVIRDEANPMMRCVIRNPAYNRVRELRGHQPNPEFRVLELLNNEAPMQLAEYLHYFGEHRPIADDLYARRMDLVKRLMHFYKNIFIFKNVTLKMAPFELKPHLYALQGQYIETLSKQGLRMTPDVIYQYIVSLPAARLLFTLNAQRTEHVVEFGAEHEEVSVHAC